MEPSPSQSSPSTDCSYEDIFHIFVVVVLVALAAVAMLLLHALGSLRRQSSHGLLHNVVMAIDTLSYPLVSYTIGRMSSSNCYVIDFAVWAVFMLLLLGSTDNLTACRLNDIENWKSIYVKHLFKAFLVVYVVVDITVLENGRFPYHFPLLGILLVGFLKWYVRIASMRMVSKAYLSKNMKVITEYMVKEQNDDDNNNRLGYFNPETMEGYKYIVAGEKFLFNRPGCTPCCGERDLKVITVEDIWKCEGNLLRRERGKLLKDVCLSMALSKMLNRKFAGFNLSEAGLEKTHDFMFKGLLVTGDKPYQRAFRVIEEELVFVHDIYYTRYSYLYHKSRYLGLFLPAIMFGLCWWLIYQIERGHSHRLFKLTIFMTVVLAFLEAYQLYLYIASGWFKVALLRSYVTTPFLQGSSCCGLEMVIGLILRLKAFRPWKNRVGQYCILHDVGQKRWVRNCLHYATLRLVDKVKNNKGSKKSVELSESVKKAVVDSLLRSKGHLTNGVISVTSLQNNEVHDKLPWKFQDPATATDGWVTRTIVVWHIATTLCKHHLDAQAKKENYAPEEDMVTVATTLSQYCMHLLVFAPKLLPDHSTISESILDQSVEEAAELVKGCKSKEKLCERLIGNNTPTSDGEGEEAKLVMRGARLARYLIANIKEPASRWKVLSEFWAEMMLYVSPSDNAWAHLEGLAKGGEFITHVWALLTHAGVLKRGHTGP